MKQQDKLLREIVKHTLTNWEKFDGWTLQGFGMLRLYMPDCNTRMVVWDRAHQTKNVSLIHTHPWHFESYVVCGEIFNYRYIETILNPHAKAYARQSIHAGEGGGLVGVPTEVMLFGATQPERVPPGHTYRQRPEEIHQTDYTDGTVTLCDRSLPYGADPNHALVYWPSNMVWVSAEPRKPTKDEINDITKKALVLL